MQRGKNVISFCRRSLDGGLTLPSADDAASERVLFVLHINTPKYLSQ